MTQTTMPYTTHDLAQNVAALSDNIHTHSDYERAYANQNKNHQRGFPELWSEVACAAITFTDVVHEYGFDYSQFDWIETIEMLASIIVSDWQEEWPCLDYRKFAKEAINANLYS